MIADKIILQPIAEYLKEELQKTLIIQGKTASGELVDSIEVVVNDISGGFEIAGSSIYYGQYVERGRKPGAKGVPISALLRWIRQRNIRIPGVSEKSTAFMFQASIKRKGIKPIRFVETTLDKYESRVQGDIEQVLYSAALGAIERMFLEIFKKV